MREVVVLLHGIWRTPLSMWGIARKLRKTGYHVLNIGYPSFKQTLDASADSVHAKIGHTINSATKVHFVGFSMGGLVIRAYLQKYATPQTGRLVFIGTPNHGSELADYVKDWRLYKWLFGPAGQQLITNKSIRANLLPSADGHEVGIISGTRKSDPFTARCFTDAHDGKVSVASSTLDGMHDHVQFPLSHTYLLLSRKVSQQVVHFIQHGNFSHV